MLLNKLFDVLRGWPREGAIDESFVINQTSPPAFDAIPLGTVFTVNSTGKAVAATTPNRTTTDAVDVWVCVAGNDDYSSQFTSKVVGLRSNAMFRLSVADNLVAGTYTPGVKLSFNAGKFKVAAITEQIIGHVVADNSATSGTVDVFFTGGDTAKL